MNIRKLKALPDLVRWPNLFIILLTQVLVFYALIGRYYQQGNQHPALTIFQFSLLVVATVLIAAAGYAINDYFDAEADQINKPEKNQVGKLYKPEAVVWGYAIANLLAVGAGFYLSLQLDSYRLGLIFPMIVIMLWFYSATYKRKVLSGNVSVAFMSALVILIVWLFEFFALRLQPGKFIWVYQSLWSITYVVLGYAGFAFLVSLVREIVKDMEDAAGDSATGCRTLPVVYGAMVAVRVSQALLGLVFLLLVFSAYWLFQQKSVITSLYYLVLIGSLVLSLIYRIHKVREPQQLHSLSRQLKLLMLAGIAGMILFAFYL